MPFRFGYKYTTNEDSLVMDGTEQTLYEETNPKRVVELYIDLTPMQAGDTIVVKEYAKPKNGGAYVFYGSETYVDVQTIKLLYVTPMPNSNGLKVTIRQTTGVMRMIDYHYGIENRC
jgi:hypothetical protein